jgi:phospholipase/carboxylesterase
MKRVQLSALASLPVEKPRTRVGTNTNHFRDGESFSKTLAGGQQHCATSLFIPQGHEPSYAYPLIVWLHSDGDDAGQLLRVMPQISLRNFAAVAPQSTIGNSDTGFYWEQNSSGIESAVRDVAYAIDYARIRMNIASRRIFVAGSGAGGTMAFRVAFRLSNLVSGVVSINGAFPAGLQPLQAWPDCSDLQVCWLHSRDNRDFPEEALCSQLGLLHVAGFDVQLRQYPGEEECPVPALNEVNRWVMGQIGSAIL